MVPSSPFVTKLNSNTLTPLDEPTILIRGWSFGIGFPLILKAGVRATLPLSHVILTFSPTATLAEGSAVMEDCCPARKG